MVPDEEYSEECTTPEVHYKPLHYPSYSFQSSSASSLILPSFPPSLEKEESSKPQSAATSQPTRWLLWKRTSMGEDVEKTGQDSRALSVGMQHGAVTVEHSVEV